MFRGIPDLKELIAGGHHPIHAAYVRAQNYASGFAEVVSQLKELEEYVKVVGSAEDTYLPSGPPMSPLTGSYFTTWAFFDVRFGPDGETLGTCILDLADVLGLETLLVETFQSFQQTRMGIYENMGLAASRVRLKELVTGKEFICHSPTGYQGKPGDLWYVRLSPPVGALGDEHIVMTTAYVLRDVSKHDWTGYLKRNLLGSLNPEAALDEFLKYGPTPTHWLEFVFLAYHHHQFDPIFLAGRPDVRSSLPHAD